MESLLQDIRYGLRLLRRGPLLAGAVVLTLTLGIGLNAGVFTVLNGLLLRARVEKDPDRFAHVSAQYSGDAARALLEGSVSIDDFEAYRRRVHSVENIAAWGIGRATIGTEDTAPTLLLPVTCNFFSLYGLEQAKAGRLFRAEECAQPGESPVAVISEELWRSRFGADPRVPGGTIRLNRVPFTIVGITPEGFSGRLRGPGIWVPYTMQRVFFGGADLWRERSTAWLMMEGRLARGQTRASAQAELAVLARQQDRLVPSRKTTIFVTNGSFVQEPAIRAQLLWIAPLIMGALTLILLLACTNVTMLLLSRAAARQREIGIRLSLGAGRARLLRLLLTESLILAAAAGAISAWVAGRVPGLVARLIPNMPHYQLAPDMLVFAYLAGVTLAAGMIAGMAPAAESLKVDLTAALKGTGGLFGSRRSRMHGTLVGAQVAMSLVLLAGAGLFVRAELTTFRANPGFETRQVLLFSARTPMPPYTAGSSAAFYRTLEQRLRALPAVQSVAFASAPPFSSDEGGGPRDELLLPGQAKGAGTKAGVNVVSPGYFATLGIPIVRGRSFQPDEVPAEGAVSPIVISEALARTLWPARDPVGQLVRDTDGEALEVAGIARNVDSQRLGALDGPAFYRLRDPRSYGDSILVRFQGEAPAMQEAVRSLIHGMDREMLPRVATLQSVMDDFAAIFWRMARMVLVLGAVAIVLAVVGIYGVVAYSVSRRMREMGIRMALGATRADIVRSVMASGARPIAVGLLIGMALSIAAAGALAQALRAMPVGLDVYDPVPYLAVTLLLALTALAAMFLPALRAGRADPLNALRQD